MESASGGAKGECESALELCVLSSAFFLLGGRGASQLPGCEGGRGRVSFGVGCCCLLSFFGGAGGESASGCVCCLLRGMEASQLPGGRKGKGGESALELCVLSSAFFFWGGGGGGPVSFRAVKGEGGESALELGVVVVCFLFLGGRGASQLPGVCVVFCGEWRRVSFQGGKGGRGASQLWSCVCCRLLFFRAVKGE